MIKIAEKESKKKKDRYTISEIATQTEPVIVDTNTEDQLSVMAFLAKIGNELEKIKKALL